MSSGRRLPWSSGPLDCRAVGTARVMVGSSILPLELEIKLQCELNFPGLFGASDATKVGSVGNIAVGIIELSVIEQIEKFRSELETLPFADWQHLVQSE